MDFDSKLDPKVLRDITSITMDMKLDEFCICYGLWSSTKFPRRNLVCKIDLQKFKTSYPNFANLANEK